MRRLGTGMSQKTCRNQVKPSEPGVRFPQDECKMLLPVITIVAASLAAHPAQPEQPEAQTDSLQAVTVVADRGVIVSRTDTVRTSSSISLAEALGTVPGLLVTDNGGAAGLKTVSLRGLGGAHTAIYLDGVRVGNVQSGQTDLGMLDPEGCGAVIVDYAQNSISFMTSKPDFRNRPVGGMVKFRGGSFGTYEPWGRLDFRLNDHASMSATAGGVISKGNYRYGDENLRRSNNDIKQVRTGLDFRGSMPGGDWHAKAFFNGAERGTPGSTSWPSSDRQRDRNAFVQGLVREQFTPLYHLSASAKASYDDLLYKSEWGDSQYGQMEIQVNTAHRFSITGWFDASLAADFQWDGLKSTGYDAGRSIVVATAAAAFHPEKFKADIAAEYSGIFDKGGKSRHVFSPSLDIRWNAFEGFYITAFGRRAYRTPTFNELYYPGFGNPDLKAEDAWLTDLGVEYHREIADGLRLTAKADGFFNHLKNKIISAPTEEDPNIWLPFNVGVVRVAGTDLLAALDFASGDWAARFSARYSLQDAVDRTKGSATLNEQIPFVARHSVRLDTGASFRGWGIDLDWNWRGGRRDTYGELPNYNTLNLTAGKDISLPKDLVLGLKFIARNLTDCRYELTSGYPMPGRAFFGEIVFKF